MLSACCVCSFKRVASHHAAHCGRVLHHSPLVSTADAKLKSPPPPHPTPLLRTDHQRSPLFSLKWVTILLYCVSHAARNSSTVSFCPADSFFFIFSQSPSNENGHVSWTVNQTLTCDLIRYVLLWSDFRVLIHRHYRLRSKQAAQTVTKEQLWKTSFKTSCYVLLVYSPKTVWDIEKKTCSPYILFFFFPSEKNIVIHCVSDSIRLQIKRLFVYCWKRSTDSWRQNVPV